MCDMFRFLYEYFQRNVCDSCTLQAQQGCKRELERREFFNRAHLDQNLSNEVPSHAGLVSWASVESLSYEICFMQLAHTHTQNWCLFMSERAKVEPTQE